MKNKTALILLPLLLAGPAAAAPSLTQDAKAQQRYEHCLNAANLNPGDALTEADAWVRAGGGAPAQHCAAIALTGLKRYGEAAGKLDALARAPGVGALRAELFDQAGNAWILAGQADKAIASLSSALALSGGDADLYADLARAQALQSDWPQVETDLNAALAVSPRRADLLVLRASARLAQGELRAARADADAALKISPNSPEALLQRGAVKRDSGDLGGAAADFEAARKLDPNGETARAAERNLAALDAVKVRKK